MSVVHNTNYKKFTAMSAHIPQMNEVLFCCLTASIDQRNALEVYQCELGHDVMKLSGQIALNGVSICAVGIMPLVSGPQNIDQLMVDFFTGITLKTGGLFVQTSHVKHLSEVKANIFFLSKS